MFATMQDTDLVRHPDRDRTLALWAAGSGI